MFKASIRHFSLIFILFISSVQEVTAQNNELRFAIYNTLIGSFTGSIGSLINKKKDERWTEVLSKGFIKGSIGGGIMYWGKKMNYLVAQKNELGFVWLSRIVYSTGNSIVENAAANRGFLEQWHFDVGFVRLQLNCVTQKVNAQVMPSTFLGTLYTASTATLDVPKTLRSGTPIFHSNIIQADTSIAAFTPGNAMVYRTFQEEPKLYATFAHEIVHMYQFQDFNGLNCFLTPISHQWQEKSKAYRKFNRWVYPDYSYEVMLVNYFIINKGGNGYNYCKNFLENEAQFLSNQKTACGF